jgi:hypothetical protein
MVYELILSLYFPTDLLKIPRMLPTREMGTCLFQQSKAHPASQMAHFLSWEFLKHNSKWVKSLIECNSLHFIIFSSLYTSFFLFLFSCPTWLFLPFGLLSSLVQSSNLALLDSPTVNSPLVCLLLQLGTESSLQPTLACLFQLGFINFPTRQLFFSLLIL